METFPLIFTQLRWLIRLFSLWESSTIECQSLSAACKFGYHFGHSDRRLNSMEMVQWGKGEMRPTNKDTDFGSVSRQT